MIPVRGRAIGGLNRDVREGDYYLIEGTEDEGLLIGRKGKGTPRRGDINNYFIR